MNKGKILFISNEASRTGAPIILLQLVKWLEIHTSLEFEILSPKGILLTSFKEICKVYLWKPLPPEINTKSPIKKSVFKIMYALLHLSNTLTFLSLSDYKIIYANTIASLKQAIYLKHNSRSNPKIILHLHELKTIIELYLPNCADYYSEVDQFIVPSNLVKETLVKIWDINPKKIKLVREFSTAKVTQIDFPNEQDYLHIGGSGLVHWRKGHDLFIQVAYKIAKSYPEKKVKFTWVGKISNEQRIIIKNDLEKTGLIDTIEFVGRQENPIPYFNQFDIFLLPSREDPFPLVCIEVGLLGKPIICFEKATGTAEIIENGGGFIVPYLDTDVMVEKIVYYYHHPKKMEHDGLVNQRQFAQFTPENQCPKIYQIIKQLLN